MAWDAFDAEDPSPSGPRFCPRCGKQGAGGTDLCAECGERLIGQGYCGVCDRYWLLPAGQPCPKHEIELEPDRPPPHPLLESGEPVAWTTVARFANPAVAQPPRLRLEAEGIPTFLDGERMGAESAYHVATGGVRLQVPAALQSEARVLLGQTWGTPAAGDDLDDAYDELAPEPGGRRRVVMRGLIVVFLLLPLIHVLALQLLRVWSRRG